MTRPKPETAHHVTLARCTCGTLTLQLRREDSSIVATAALPLNGMDAFTSAILDAWEAAMQVQPGNCGGGH